MKTKKFVLSFVKFSIPSVASAIVALSILPLVSRVYDGAEYGYISNFYSIGNLLMGLFLIGLDSAYMRYYNESIEKNSRSGMLVFSLKVGIIVCSLVFGFSFILFKDAVSSFLFNDENSLGMVLLYFYVILLMVYRFLNINNRFSERVLSYNIQQVCFILGNRLLFVLAIFYSGRYIYSCTIMLLSTAVIVIVSIFCQRKEFKNPSISKKVRVDMIKYGFPLMPATAILYLNDSIAKLVLGGFGFREDVGYFAIATSIANVFSIVPSAFNVYWGPFMYKNYKKEKDLICNVHDVIMLLSITLTVVIFLAQDIIYLILGENYRTSQSYFMLIMLTPIFGLLSETTSYGISLAKKTQYILFTAIIGCVLNVLLCSILIPLEGALGAAIGVAVSVTSIFVVKSIIAQKYYRSINAFYKTFFTTLLIIALCAANTFIYNNLIARIVFSVFVLFFVFVIYLKTLKGIKGIFFNMLKGIKERV